MTGDDDASIFDDDAPNAARVHWYDDCGDWKPDDFVGYTPAEVTCLTCLEDMHNDRTVPQDWLDPDDE